MNANKIHHTIHYNKLVRNDIPEKIAEQGCTVTYRTLNSDNEFKVHLLDKLFEEACELKSEALVIDFDKPLTIAESDKRNKVLEELADVYTVLFEINHLYGFNMSDIEGKYHEKNASVGGFSKRIYMVSSES